MVTDESLIAETMVWSNFSLMNAFFALKGSKLFTIISPAIDAYQRMCNIHRILNDFSETFNDKF